MVSVPSIWAKKAATLFEYIAPYQKENRTYDNLVLYNYKCRIYACSIFLILIKFETSISQELDISRK